MERETKHWLLLLIGWLAWFGVIAQFGVSINKALVEGGAVSEVFVRLLSYFTILTNLFVAIVATVCGFSPNSKLGQSLAKPQVFGCSVTAIVLVGIGFHVLLRDLYAPAGFAGFINYVIHYYVPSAMLIYWLVFPPTRRMSPWLPVAWNVYFLSYVAYIAIRGELIGKYPYPFIDVVEIGYASAVLASTVLAGAFVVLGYLVFLVARFRIKL